MKLESCWLRQMVNACGCFMRSTREKKICKFPFGAKNHLSCRLPLSRSKNRKTNIIIKKWMFSGMKNEEVENFYLKSQQEMPSSNYKNESWMGQESSPHICSIIEFVFFFFMFLQGTSKSEWETEEKGRKISDKSCFMDESFNKFNRHKAEQSQQVRAHWNANTQKNQFPFKLKW